jgi:hypothetical protein
MARQQFPRIGQCAHRPVLGPDDEGNVRILPQVYGFSRGLERIKDNLERFANCKTDHRGLWSIVGERCLDC